MTYLSYIYKICHSHAEIKNLFFSKASTEDNNL